MANIRIEDDIILAAINMAEDSHENLSGMSYQQGVIDALEWVIGYTDEFEFSPTK